MILLQLYKQKMPDYHKDVCVNPAKTPKMKKLTSKLIATRKFCWKLPSTDFRLRRAMEEESRVSNRKTLMQPVGHKRVGQPVVRHSSTRRL
jgi:hypothetical protein